MASTNGFLGFDQFIWFQGVVEDRLDPLKLGRLRVRILGIHTEDKTRIPTNELPWASPVMPIQNASMNGIGDTPMGPVEGTWVIGFFRDGENCQEPIVFGSLLGIPQTRPNPAIGFADPFDFYPEDRYLKEPDTNRLARNEKINETVIQRRREKLVRNIPVALERVSENGDSREESDDTTWSEPEPTYDAKYPFNRVFQSESGHIREYDDTKGKTRIHEYHQLGTFYEIYEVDDEGEKKANKLTKINGENYQIVLGDDHIYVSGSCNITVDGRINIYAGNDINIEANERVNIVAKGNTSVYCHQNLSVVVEKDMNLDVGGDLNISADNIRMTATRDFTVNTTLGSIAMAAKTTMGLSSLLNMNISSLSSIIANSTISTEIGSVGSITVNSTFTSINSTVKTTVGSLLSTLIKTGINLDLESLTSLVNVRSIARINLEAPIVSRKFPKIAPIGQLTFNP